MVSIFQRSNQAFNQGLTLLKRGGATPTAQQAKSMARTAVGPSPYTTRAAGAVSTGDPFLDAAGGNLQSRAAAGDPRFGQAYSMIAGAAPDLGGLTAELAGGNSQFDLAADGYQTSVGSPAVRRTMNQYLNPYQDQVIDNVSRRFDDRRRNDLNEVRAQAARANAFGGDRQALVEAELYDRYAQEETDVISELLNQGFNTAAQFGQGQQQLEQGAAAGQAGLSRDRVNQLVASGQMSLAEAQQLLNAGTGMADVASAEGSLDVAINQALGSIGASRGNLENQGAGVLADMGAQEQQRRLMAAQLFAQLSGQQGNQDIAAGQALIGGAQIGTGMGQSALEGLATSGAGVRSMNQNILGQGAQQYDAYSNYPLNSLQTALAAIQGNPLAGGGTTTQTSNPGMLDFLSLAMGLGSRGMVG